MSFPSRHLKGFSLLEVLIATFIFSLIMVGITSYFVSITSANQNTKRLQQNLEDVRFAMNRIAKVLRTSVIIDSSSPTWIKVYDYSQGSCIAYDFTVTNTIREGSIANSGPASAEKPWCASQNPLASASSIVSVTGGTLVGKFLVVPSDDGTVPGGSKVAGRVTMNATITRQNNSSTVQTTVSLRNYKEVYH